MNQIFLWAFILEIWLTMFIIWGVWHEDRLVRFEQRIAETVKKAVRRWIG